VDHGVMEVGVVSVERLLDMVWKCDRGGCHRL
jgi:hypothetical protein